MTGACLLLAPGALGEQSAPQAVTAPSAEGAPVQTATETPREATPAFDRVSGQVMGRRVVSAAGRGPGIAIVSPGQAFEPYLDREIEYRDDEIPQGGARMTLTSFEGGRRAPGTGTTTAASMEGEQPPAGAASPSSPDSDDITISENRPNGHTHTHTNGR